VSTAGLDLSRLRAYLDRNAPGLVSGDLTAELFSGGRSNLTYALTDGTDRWVLRRPPLGHVLPTAHDMTREHRVLAALGQVRFPVPGVAHLCTDPTVIGAPFYLMEHVDGTIHREPADLERLGPERVRGIALTLVDTLARLHALEPAGTGLADFGRPDGFNTRQVRRWKRQLDASRSRDLPGFDELHDRLAARVPAGSATVVHGDYRLDNVILSPDDTVRAVLDWEMSTLGDPLGDLALMLVYADLPVPSAAGPSAAGPSSTDPPAAGPERSVLQVAGYPDAGTLAAHYALRSGRDVSDLQWYIAFADFKLAVILEGVHYRYVHGQTVGAGFDTIGRRVPRLVAQGHEALGST
jgi:aminoglycoside phosphotransferase (APT) family kinase protein